MKAIAGTLPWAVVLLAARSAIWWLLSQEMAAGRWLLGALLVGHGMVHLLFAVPAASANPDGREWPFDLTRPSLPVAAGLDRTKLRVAGMGLIAVSIAGFVLAALSTVGIAVPPGLWPVTVAGAALASAAVLVLFIHPQLVLGLGTDAVLLWMVATRAWAP